VDVAALRPPYGGITPIDCPLEPQVARAYDEARSFAILKRRESLETTHLLYGVLSSKGEVTTWLMAEAGVGPAVVLGRLDDRVREHDFRGEAVPTRNYHECELLAEEVAWKAGVPSVREQDLLWALLIKSRDSRKLQRTCKAIGLDLTRLAVLLAERCPRPDFAVEDSSSIASGQLE
jgi:ATP-dependent Clp protease ATP-binding subunit ClpA